MVRRCNLCSRGLPSPFSSRVSLPTLLFVAFVFSLNIFAIFTVFTVSNSKPPLPLQIGANQHPHPQQRELSWNGGGESREALKSPGESQSVNSNGGGELVEVATEDTESHLIRSPDTRSSFEFAL